MKRSPIPRDPDDFYRTPPHVTSALLTVEEFTGPVWEPACGDGAISEVLRTRGFDVFSTDLIERGYGPGGLDFLAQRELAAPEIITNPPYRLADRFALHALALGARKVALLLRLAWLEGEKRKRAVFDHHPPARVWVLSARPTLWIGTDPNPRDTGGATAYAWFVWEREHAGPPVLGWIGRDADLAAMLA